MGEAKRFGGWGGGWCGVCYGVYVAATVFCRMFVNFFSLFLAFCSTLPLGSHWLITTDATLI